MDVVVKASTWVPAQGALVEVTSPAPGLLMVNSETLEAYPRELYAGDNQIQVYLRHGQRPPVTIDAGHVLGRVVVVQNAVRTALAEADVTEVAGSAGRSGQRTGRTK